MARSSSICTAPEKYSATIGIQKLMIAVLRCSRQVDRFLIERIERGSPCVLNLVGHALTLLLLTVLFCHHSYAQSCAPWHLINSLGGRVITTLDILRSSPDTVYAAGAGLYRSSNHGRDWDSLGQFGYGLLKVNPFNSTT